MNSSLFYVSLSLFIQLESRRKIAVILNDILTRTKLPNLFPWCDPRKKITFWFRMTMTYHFSVFSVFLLVKLVYFLSIVTSWLFEAHDFFYLFCIAGEGSSTFLNFVKGDLILLDEDTSGEAVLTSGWCTGTCERTEERGDFPAEVVYVLPCLSRPPDDILVRSPNLYPIFPLWSL